ncbi:hypothetical protein SAMN05444365_101274 [Micromonospora pattaloongensis]|uniref:Uncharacterized protein n=1 Tax=Micromonospora pattaloongensis TaxID=405436 RepID=A0A1H3G4I5_9ACTN|nr:hypothetical protein [Micromonospora pattaloongensis]SDX97947.1 hypothetical protein SAMN05444365_101274 [Micromonospora pattaloongensis]
MDVVVGTTGRREMLVVLVLAAVGVLLALLAAFTPWYAAPVDRSAVVDVTVPAPPGNDAG